MSMPDLPWPVRQDIDPYERLSALVPLEASLVVDGGANKGRTVARLLARFPAARLVAYEPIGRLAGKLAKRYADEPRVTVRRAALGDKPGELPLYELETVTCSSLLAPTGILRKHPDKPMAVASRAAVRVVRLDEELSRAPDLIKLDLQGYELSALKGAERVLPGVRAVLCEVAFAAMYEGQPLCDEVAGWMSGRGFHLEGLYSPWRDAEGALACADAIFTPRGGWNRGCARRALPL
jgi:FkbM family methyltransferase